MHPIPQSKKKATRTVVAHVVSVNELNGTTLIPATSWTSFSCIVQAEPRCCKTTSTWHHDFSAHEHNADGQKIFIVDSTIFTCTLQITVRRMRLTHPEFTNASHDRANIKLHKSKTSCAARQSVCDGVMVMITTDSRHSTKKPCPTNACHPSSKYLPTFNGFKKTKNIPNTSPKQKSLLWMTGA